MDWDRLTKVLIERKILSRVKDARKHQLFLAKQRMLARKQRQETELVKDLEEDEGLEELKDISNAEGVYCNLV